MPSSALLYYRPMGLSGLRKLVEFMKSAAIEWLFPAKDDVKSLHIISPERFLSEVMQSRPSPRFIWKAEEPELMTHIQSLFRYSDPFVRKALWELKYKGDLHLAEVFAEFIKREVSVLTKTYRQYGMARPPLLIPLPSSKRRLRERGWNQTFLVTGALEKISGGICEVRTDILIKIRHTPPQTQQSMAARRTNLKGCFGLANGTDVCGRVAILFDDVLTTGSTLKEAAEAMKAACVSEIIGLTIAH
jgi:ComF family protein